MAALEVELVAADRPIWSGEAAMVVAPAADGEIGILAGHQPLLSVLRPGVVRVHGNAGEVLEARIEAGFLSVDADQVTVVVDAADVVGGSRR